MDGSPVRTRDESASPNPNQSPDGETKTMPHQKSINLLPEVPMQTSRKLSDREQRDCEVIGTTSFIFFK